MGTDCCYNCFAARIGPGACPRCGYAPEMDAGKYPNALPHGSILAGRYVTGRVLGQGGFGITYLALDRAAGEKVAIKEFMPEASAGRAPGATRVAVRSGGGEELFRYGLERFLDEAKVLAQFTGNPHVARVRQYFQENGTAYFAMDYVEGVSFKAVLRERGGRVAWREAARVLRPVMDALEAVHREGLIHRDVTPDNIYLTGNGDVKLLDFGSARYSLGERSRSLDVVLKAGYAPVEQYTRRGRQGPWTDVYSVAACFYAAITGILPVEAPERAEQDRLVLISQRGIKIPQGLEAVIYRGMAVRPSDRYQTMGEFATAVDQAMEPDPNPIPVPPPPPQPPEPAPPPPPGPAREEKTAVNVICLTALGAAGIVLAAVLLANGLLVGILPAGVALAAFAVGVVLALRGRGEKRAELYRAGCAAYSGGDYQTAVPLFQQAAKLGSRKAEYCLGECCRWGNGMPQDMSAAFRWYLSSARGGNEDAYYVVGCCYADGDGVAPSRGQAALWLNKAAASQTGAAAAAKRKLDALQTSQVG